MYFKNKNDEYFTKNFSKLVEKYGGNWIVIAGGKRIGICPKHKVNEILKKAKKKYPKDIPLISPIPKDEEIECIL